MKYLLILAILVAYSLAEYRDWSSVHALIRSGVNQDVAECMVRMEYSRSECERSLSTGVWFGPDSVVREYPPARMVAVTN